MDEIWTDEKLIAYLKTLGSDAKLVLVYSAGAMIDRLATLQEAVQDLADACPDEKNVPASFVLSGSDQAKIQQAAALLEEVHSALKHRTGFFITATLDEFAAKGGQQHG